MSDPRRPGSDPVPLRAGLDAVVRGLKGHDAATVRNVFSGWAEAVGPAVAAHARPLKLDGRVLVVEVDEPGWATQLRYLQADILGRVQQAGSGPIERLEITVRGARATSARSRAGRRTNRRVTAD